VPRAHGSGSGSRAGVAARHTSAAMLPLPEPWAPGRDVRCARIADLDASPRTAAAAPVHLLARADDRTPVLRVDGLGAGYQDRQVLFDVSLDAYAGECLAIVGESGSGKTTLSQCIAGLQARWHGGLSMRGEELAPWAHDRTRQQRRDVQYVFQNPYASLNPRATVGSSIGVPLHFFFGLNGKRRQQRVAELLDRVELSADAATRYPSELSGGQRQRAAIARALACEPRLLICDEVTSALDVSVQAAVVELLRTLLEGDLSMLFVTHNLAVVRSLADRVVVLNQGVVVENGPTEAVLDAPTDDYTRRLLADALDVPTASVA